MFEAILAAEETHILVWAFVAVVFLYAIASMAGGSWTPHSNPMDTDDFEGGDN